MSRRTMLMAGVAGLVAVTALTGGAVAVARVVDDEDQTVMGPEAEQATTAAVEAAGGGQATAVERDNEGSAVWEVEVTRPDGTVAEVRVDAANQVVVLNEEREGNEASDDGDTPDHDADDTEDGDYD